MENFKKGPYIDITECGEIIYTTANVMQRQTLSTQLCRTAPDESLDLMEYLFSKGDIVEFTPIGGELKRGYITELDCKLIIRCPHPYYEYHPIYDNTVIIKKGGWKTDEI